MTQKKESDYHFMFQTSGVPLLFSDICLRYYFSFDFDGLIFQHNNQYKQYITKNYVDLAKKKYQEFYRDRNTVEAFCDECLTAKNEFLVWRDKIKDVECINEKDFDEAFSLILKVQSAYSKTDSIYTDFLFNDSERNTESLKTLVLEKKNVLREEINKVFFTEDSSYVLLQKKISEQTHIPFKDISYLPISTLREVLAGKFFPDLYKGNPDYVIIRENNSFTYLFGDAATEFINNFVESIDVSVKELKGVSVSKKAIIQGKVRKVLVDYEHFEESIKSINSSGEGYIVVTDATIPEFVPLMKKAKAIVTNVGGLLSHAAITSRELGIPCIVGTKNATEILKDGDMVEVDAEKGIVRILK